MLMVPLILLLDFLKNQSVFHYWQLWEQMIMKSKSYPWLMKWANTINLYFYNDILMIDLISTRPIHMIPLMNIWNLLELKAIKKLVY